MTKNEYIASIMLEAADLLQESAGRNGYMRRKVNEDLKEIERLGCEEVSKYLNGDDVLAIKHKSDKINSDYNKARKGDKNVNKWNATASKIDVMRNNEMNKRHNEKDWYLHAKINARGNALKEAIDLLYDKAANADTLDEATMYIDKAEQLESMIEE